MISKEFNTISDTTQDTFLIWRKTASHATHPSTDALCSLAELEPVSEAAVVLRRDSRLTCDRINKQ